jgi:hypothetical protein
MADSRYQGKGKGRADLHNTDITDTTPNTYHSTYHITSSPEVEILEQPHESKQVTDLISNAQKLLQQAREKLDERGAFSKDEELVRLRNLSFTQQQQIEALKAENTRLSHRLGEVHRELASTYTNVAEAPGLSSAREDREFSIQAGSSSRITNSHNAAVPRTSRLRNRDELCDLQGVPSLAQQASYATHGRPSKRSHSELTITALEGDASMPGQARVSSSPARVVKAPVSNRKGFTKKADPAPPTADEMFSELDFWDESSTDGSHRLPTTTWTDAFKTMVQPHLTDRFCANTTALRALTAKNTGDRRDKAICAQMKVSKITANADLPDESCAYCRDKKLICVRKRNGTRPMAVPLPAPLRAGFRSDELGYWVQQQ